METSTSGGRGSGEKHQSWESDATSKPSDGGKNKKKRKTGKRGSMSMDLPDWQWLQPGMKAMTIGDGARLVETNRRQEETSKQRGTSDGNPT